MIGDQGFVATTSLILLVPITFFLFSSRRPARAAALVAFGAVFFAPELAFFKFPSFPPLTKENIPYLCMALAALVQFPTTLWRSKPGRGPEFLILIALAGTFGTVATNKDVLVYGTWVTTVLPPMTVNDGLAMGISDVLMMLVPFFMGRMLFKTSRDLIDLVKVIVGYGAIYVVFILVELRLSPQFHYWLYGFMAHEDFLQVLRWGGYRPVVFFRHGLALSLMMFHVALLATALVKVKVKLTRWLEPKLLAIGMFIVLVLCKSTGSIAYGFTIIPILAITRVKTQVRLALVIAFLVLSYPFLRELDVVPVQSLVSVAKMVSAARAESLQFRIENEDSLLEKGRERIWFGWGSYGRSLIYDADIGKSLSVTDGQWIILLGTRGVTGLLCAFILLLYPLWIARKRIGMVADKRDQMLLGALCLMVATAAFDLIPNGLFNNYPYFVAGALLGLITHLTSPGQRSPLTSGASRITTEPRNVREPA